MNSTTDPVIDKSTRLFPFSSPTGVTISKSSSEFKTPYENSLTDDRIAELHANKPIRICDDTYYAAFREKPNTVKSREQADEERLAKIEKYVADHPDCTSVMISEATGISKLQVTSICSNNADVFICMRGYRTVLYRVK